jgi:ribonuclease PH
MPTVPRRPEEARLTTIETDWVEAPAASVLIACGRTRVLCTASVDSDLPPHRVDRGGWLTAEYAMLPGSSPRRVRRPGAKPDGRATEIQRLIGRSLRAGFDLDRLGPRAIWIDCDVLEADGGTRTTAITGGYLAARIAVERLIHDGLVGREALLPAVAATSVGLVGGVPRLDLDYALDSTADVDMNVVMDAEGHLIEVQATGERRAMSRSELDALLDLAAGGIRDAFVRQEEALALALARRPGLRR